MYLLIALLCIAVAYEAAEALNRAANLTSTDPRPYSSRTSK
ncbi:MAG: hypothetical protein WCF88_07250 [Candidatus Acidiferrales bacterium]|jgi:hypothetical protein